MLGLVRISPRQIPSFALYGEQAASQHDSLHIEDIQSRSSKYLWKIASHRHMGLSQCLFVAKGPVEARLEAERSRSFGPLVILIPAGTIHGFKFGADTDGHVLTFDLDRLLSAASAAPQAAIQALFSAPRVAPLDHDLAFAERLRRLVETLAAEFRQPDSQHSPVCTWLASSVLGLLAHAIGHPDTVESWRSPEALKLWQFKAHIEANYARHWPVERYARELKMSETSLNRLCRRLAGVTAFHLIQERVALEARRRLMYLAVSINSISAELGFKDPAYFSRFFRRHCGVAPHEFRRGQAGG